MKYQEYQDKMDLKVEKLEDIIRRLRNGENVDEDILAYKKFYDPLSSVGIPDKDHAIKDNDIKPANTQNITSTDDRTTKKLSSVWI
ncbi:14022_t:CDS:2 [Acaulospora morrowiae]|uniref:14022_t:CDS:1 n=1 Tax=Acaulospora morrowiae TaxID=94023 RepID=A0A9N8Z5L2_9GLOM|nr:14022_t:CDS:2 [Acaulospora morrowiae]